jgi:hypothetical protein
MDNTFTDDLQKSNINPEDVRLEWLGTHDLEPSEMHLSSWDSKGEIDDEALVRRFALGKKRAIANQNLRIDFAHNSLQLSTPDRDLIAIHKVSDKFRYILVKKDGDYADFIHSLILEHLFVPIGMNSTDRGFVRYQKYEIPTGYKLQYAPASELWHTWKDHRQDLNLGWRLDILILAQSKWYRIQEMSIASEKIILTTRVGDITTKLREKVAWIEKLETVPPETLERTKASVKQQLNTNAISDSDILAKIMSKLAIESEPPESEIDRSEIGKSDIGLNTFDETTFDRYDISSHLSIDRQLTASGTMTDNLNNLTPDEILPSPNVSPPQRKERPLTMATKVLENYLEHGETIVRTEEVIDTDGKIVSTKTITTKRACPRWVIDTILSL